MLETDLALLLKENHQRITQIMQQKIDEYGLTFGLLYLIILIEKNPGASQKELASVMRFTQGAMSSSVKRLLKLNLVKQIPLESDMRYNKLVLTEKGKLMLNDYKDYLQKIYENIFAGFGIGELKELRDSLTKVNKNLDSIIKGNHLKNIIE